MGMPITVKIISDDTFHATEIINMVFDYFVHVEDKFSVFKDDSEISLINNGKIKMEDYSPEMKEIFKIAEKTKNETDGYFDIRNRKGIIDPSGIVKGWAIYNASLIVRKKGFHNFYINAGGDIEVGGKNENGEMWKIGIENPFVQGEIVKTLYLTDCGIATSGTYIRGQHIYNPKAMNRNIDEIVSLTVIGQNILEADRFATPAFAMGKGGIHFIEKQKDLFGYIIDSEGLATMTTGFEAFTIPPKI